MNCFRHRLFLGVLCFFVFSKINGQATTSANPNAPSLNTAAYFTTAIGEDAHLYVGKEYGRYDKNIVGYPFFMVADMQNGDIFYDGVLYKEVPLLFDIVSQEIVINRYNQNFRIKLLNEKIKYFTVGGHYFENITRFEDAGIGAGNGFYDVTNFGASSVLIKRAKRIANGLKAEDPPYFTEADEFFIQNENRLYAVADKGSLLKALDDKKELVKTYLRKNKLKLKKNFEKELVMAMTYYSTLNK